MKCSLKIYLPVATLVILLNGVWIGLIQAQTAKAMPMAML